jgi:Xaa-Pro aminopeptidase
VTANHPTLQEPSIQAILSQPYGRFSDHEFARRRKALADVAVKHDCDAILLCGEERTGTGVVWLTGWPTSARAFVIVQPNERDLLFVEHVNHVPNAQTIARDAEVRWAQLRGAGAVADEMTRRGIKRVGVIGVLTWLASRQLGAFDLVDLSEDYRWLRMRKSDEEIEWMRIGAEPTPLFQRLYDVAEQAFNAITGVLKAGVSAQELFDATALIEDAGFSTYDDIVHGFGGGYLPPVLGTKSHPSAAIPDMRLEANMTIVVQPNVITTDYKAGVQLGEMVRITETGFERMHAAPWGFLKMN